MYLFTRTRTPKPGKEAALAEWGIGMAAFASEASGVDLNAYQAVFAGARGSGGAVTVSGVFDDFAALGKAMASVQAAKGFGSKVEEGGDLSTGTTDDHFMEIMAGTPSPGAVVTVDSGLALLSRMPDALKFGMEMRAIIAQKSGKDTVFASDMYGTLGSVVWITPADDFAMLDAQGKAIMGDPQYLKMMTEAPNVFDAPSFDRALAVRLSGD